MSFRRRGIGFFHPGAGAEQVLELEISKERVPFYTQDRTVKVRAIHLIAKASGTGNYTAEMNPPLGAAAADLITMSPSASYGGLHHGSKDVSGRPVSLASPETAWKLRLKQSAAGDFRSLNEQSVEDVFIVVAYELTSTIVSPTP